MKLIFGVLGIFASVLLFAVLLIVFRNQRPSLWKNDTLLSHIYIPAVIFLAVVGLLQVLAYLSTLGEIGFVIKDWALALVVLAGGVLAIKGMRVGKRLKQISEQQQHTASATVIELRPEEKPEPPVITRRAA